MFYDQAVKGLGLDEDCGVALLDSKQRMGCEYTFYTQVI